MANKIEFINLSYPSQGSSSSLRRRAYSHAARVNHARVKLARKSISQANNVEPHIPPTKNIEACSTAETEEICLPRAKAKEASVLFPDPIDPLTSNRRDPFGCLVRPLSQLEHYLFDHCKLMCSVTVNLFGDWLPVLRLSLICVLSDRCNRRHYPV